MSDLNGTMSSDRLSDVASKEAKAKARAEAKAAKAKADREKAREEAARLKASRSLSMRLWAATGKVGENLKTSIKTADGAFAMSAEGVNLKGEDFQRSAKLKGAKVSGKGGEGYGDANPTRSGAVSGDAAEAIALAIMHPDLIDEVEETIDQIAESEGEGDENE